MKIDGRAIAERIYNTLAGEITHLAITPTLAVIQVGDDEASSIYINQKKKAAQRIGANLVHIKFPLNISIAKINKTITQYNNDSSIHGVIVQRPLPPHIKMIQIILMKKDVDGFLPHSPYPPPVAAAVMTILNEIHVTSGNCAVIGRGETAGGPIAETLRKKGWTVTVVHSNTKNPSEIIKKARIVISCVGKGKVITRDMVHKDTILIGVGRGDYDEDEIKDIVAYYTPTPGGVGPINVACLMQNLVKASHYSP